MIKPFSVNELLARIRVILKRSFLQRSNSSQAPVTQEFKFKNISVNLAKHSVVVRNKEIKLSPIEFKILIFLMTYAGDVFSREKLLDNVWGRDSFVEPRTVDVHIRRLRSSIEVDESIKLIETVRGAGYKFADEED